MRALTVFNRALIPGSASGPDAVHFPHAFAPLYDASQRTHLAIALKASFRLSTGAPLPRASQEQALLVDVHGVDGSLQTPADIALGRTGTSVAVRGRIADSSAELALSVEVGPLSGRYRFSPNRIWARRGNGWEASERRDGSSHAQREFSWVSFFGGTDGDVTYGANPVGTGFVVVAERAEGRAIPALEEVGAEIQEPLARGRATLPSFLPAHWEDRRALFPFDDSRRGDALSWPENLDPRFFDVVPQCWVQRPFFRGGEPIRISGLVTAASPSGAPMLCTSSIPRRAFRLVYGHKTVPMDLTIVRIEPAEDLIVLTFAATVRRSFTSTDAPPIQIVEKRVVERAEP